MEFSGYVVVSNTGSLLTRDFMWRKDAHEYLEDGFVHKKTIEELIELSKEWNIKPRIFFPAVYSEKRGVKIKTSGIHIIM